MPDAQPQLWRVLGNLERGQAEAENARRELIATNKDILCEIKNFRGEVARRIEPLEQTHRQLKSAKRAFWSAVTVLVSGGALDVLLRYWDKTR